MARRGSLRACSRGPGQAQGHAASSEITGWPHCKCLQQGPGQPGGEQKGGLLGWACLQFLLKFPFLHFSIETSIENMYYF